LYPYHTGVTTITWTATDNCNNSTTRDQTITITDQNRFLTTVQLSPGLQTSPDNPSPTLSRCMTFGLWACDPSTSSPTVTVSQVLPFNVSGPNAGKAVDQTVYVPC